jgi:hypothetical protein
MLFLTSCAKTEYVYITIPIYPPTEYLMPVQEPKLKGKTNNDLAKYIFNLRTAIAEGNKHKEKMLLWIKEQESKEKENNT